jgi:hypothetical protein
MAVETIKKRLESRANQTEKALYEKTSEREAKMAECDNAWNDKHNNKERSEGKRIEWDLKGVEEIFKVLELNLTQDKIKFCKGMGEND